MVFKLNYLLIKEETKNYFLFLIRSAYGGIYNETLKAEKAQKRIRYEMTPKLPKRPFNGRPLNTE